MKSTMEQQVFDNPAMENPATEGCASDYQAPECDAQTKGDAQVDTAEAVEPVVEQTVEEKLALAEAEIADLKDRLARQMADFANFRKHSIARQTELILNGGQKVLESLLPILDDMERAAANMAKSDDVNTLREGLELVTQKLMRTLEQQGLKRMDTTDAPFDTDYHEAIALLPTEDETKKGLVMDCVQTGYLLNDKVLRHAKVAVGQ